MAKYINLIVEPIMQMLEVLEICNSNDPDASVIWLHGLGADGHDFAPVVEQLGLAHIRFILPHAPKRPVTLNSGYVMPAWYDIYGLEAGSKQDEDGIRTTQSQIEALIAREHERGIPFKRIVLAGFSQGGAIVLHTGLRHARPLAGILALSTYLPLTAKLPSEAHPANQQLPLFMAHGIFDNVISIKVAQASMNFLKQHNYAVTWCEYPMAHSVCAEEITDIRNFLRNALA